MEIADWDAGSVTLTGLSLDMTPSKAREALEKGLVQPFPDNMVTSSIRMMGLRVFNHQKLVSFYQGDEMHAPAALGYFMCASYYNPKTPTKNGKQPRLRDSQPLPLAEWENFYYAIVAEIRSFYVELQTKYGSEFEHGHLIIHTKGFEGASRTSTDWSALAMAGQLEEYWRSLMDNRLVASLDRAIREKQAQEALAAKKGEGEADVTTNDTPIQGLMDVNSMKPQEILDALWIKHEKEKIEQTRASGSSIEEVTFLALARAEIRNAGLLRSNSKAAKAKMCEYPAYCDCRVGCNFTINNCSCKPGRKQVEDLIKEQYVTDAAARKSLVTASPGKKIEPKHHLFGAVTNELAQMQVAAVATEGPFMINVCHKSSAAADILDAQLLDLHRRERAGTATSNVSSVAPLKTTPSRAVKDAFPLGFYGGLSSQRYPSFHADLTTPPPVFGASVPARKPLPLSVTTTDLPSSNTTQSKPNDIPTPPTSSPYYVQTFAEAKHRISHESTSQKYGLFPPLLASRSEQSNPEIDRSVSVAEYTQLAADAESTYHPFDDSPKAVRPSPNLRSYTYTVGDEDGRNHFDPAVSPTSTQYALAVQKSKARARNHPQSLPSSNTYTAKLHEQIQEQLDLLPEVPRGQTPAEVEVQRRAQALEHAKARAHAEAQLHFPHTHPPDFIAPRPALRQRYVSAGGTTKLSERAEIQPPPFVEEAKAAVRHGRKMSKEEMMRVLSDPEFIRNNFGDAAVVVNDRLSQEEEGREGERRRSDESDEGLTMAMPQGEKRERATSGASFASGRIAKLRRVFSRKGTGSDSD